MLIFNNIIVLPSLCITSSNYIKPREDFKDNGFHVVDIHLKKDLVMNPKHGIQSHTLKTRWFQFVFTVEK